MKNQKVCNGCIYHLERGEHFSFNNTCEYMTITGHSRLVFERQNGGCQTDSCICYKKGERIGKGVTTWSIKRGAKK